MPFKNDTENIRITVDDTFQTSAFYNTIIDIMTKLSKEWEEFLWNQIKAIILMTGKFDYKDWVIEQYLLHIEPGNFNDDHNAISYRIRLVPNRLIDIARFNV